MINQTLGEDQYGEPVLILTVTGYHDIWRLQWNLAHAQLEFVALARKTFAWMRKRLGVKRFTAIDQSLTSGTVSRKGMHRTVED